MSLFGKDKEKKNPPTIPGNSGREVMINSPQPPMKQEQPEDEPEEDEQEPDQDDTEEIDPSQILTMDDIREIVHEGLDSGLTIPQIQKSISEYEYHYRNASGEIVRIVYQHLNAHKQTWKGGKSAPKEQELEDEEEEKPTPKRAKKVEIQSADPIDLMFNEFLDRIRKKDQKESNINTYLTEYKRARDDGDPQMAKLMLILIEKEFDRIENMKVNPQKEQDPIMQTLYSMLSKVVDKAVSGEGKKDSLEEALSIVDRIDKVRGGNNNGMPTPDDPDSWMWYTMGQVIPQSVNQISETIRDVAGHGSLADKSGQKPNPNQSQQQQQQQVGFRCNGCGNVIPLDTPACNKCGNRFPPELWRDAKQQMGIPVEQYSPPPKRPQPQPQQPQRPQYPAYQEQPRPPYEPPQPNPPQPRQPFTDEPTDGTDDDDIQEEYDPEIHGRFCNYCGGPYDDEGYCANCDETNDDDVEIIDINVPQEMPSDHEIIPQMSPPVEFGNQKQMGNIDSMRKKEGSGLTGNALPELPPEAIQMFNELHRVAIWVKQDANARQNGNQNKMIDPVNKVSSLYRLADTKAKDLPTIKALLYIRKRGISNLVQYVNLYSHDPRIKEADEVVKVLSSEYGAQWCKKALDTIFSLAQADGIHLTKEDVAKIDEELRMFSNG